MNRTLSSGPWLLAAFACLGLPAQACLAGDDGAHQLSRGKYLVEITGCNDCHTPGYATSGGETPEALWLTGDVLGWRGPWGTTYATNLRTLIPSMTEDQWVEVAQNLKSRPPMPWFSLNKMTVADLRSVYRYVASLGPAGGPAPAYVPPDQEPAPPFVTFPAPPPE